MENSVTLVDRIDALSTQIINQLNDSSLFMSKNRVDKIDAQAENALIRRKIQSMDQLTRKELEIIMRKLRNRALFSNGFVSQEDFVTVIKPLLQISTPKIKQFFDSMDTQGQGKIRWDSIINYIIGMISTKQTVDRMDYFFNPGILQSQMSHRLNIDLLEVFEGNFSSEDQIIVCGYE
ncbi:MAG: hypothetical protein EZS28_034617 [Streblomastix strix]|uniref:EF-hand domain-containing protein n=1 Tax=Streblomastix strix TaxID=222440 RepID=A0A5J4UGD8_9EUKA|nr:MAG: hypothetical protein EZS28_034617 [Streblomastix strix]